MSVPNLESLRWHSRVVVIFASQENDTKLQQQQAIAADHAPGFTERDIKVFPVVGGGSDAQTLRKKLGVSNSGFSVLLIGKDGSVKLTKTDVLTSDELFATIDAMPMRKQEMKRKK